MAESPDRDAILLAYDSIELVGSAELPLLSGYQPTIAGGGLYTSDWRGRALLYYQLRSEEREGWRGPERIASQIGMPFGTVVDSQGRVYVSDRDNKLVIRLGADNRPEASFRHTSAAEEIAYGWTDPDGVVNLFLFGPTRCNAGGSCTVRRLSLGGSSILADEAFSPIGAELPPIVTWTGTIDSRQRRVLVANVASNLVEIFDETNNLISELSLAVPSEVPVRANNRGAAGSRAYGYDGPRINRIAFTSDHLFVQWIASGPSADTYRFLVSVYDSSGRAVGAPYPTDMQLVSAADGLVTLSAFAPDHGGRVTMRRYRMRQG